jgi:hypothetical protein
VVENETNCFIAFIISAVFSLLAVAFCDDCSEADECSASQTCCPTSDDTTVCEIFRKILLNLSEQWIMITFQPAVHIKMASAAAIIHTAVPVAIIARVTAAIASLAGHKLPHQVSFDCK